MKKCIRGFKNSLLKRTECASQTSGRRTLMTNSSQSAKPTVLIAGCGYTGLRAARIWQSRSLSVSAITRSEHKAAEFRREGLQPLVLDLASDKPWPVLPPADVVLWSVGYDRSSGSDRRAVWIHGLQRFLQALQPAVTPRRLILTSSTSVYGDCEGLEVDESTIPRPSQEGGQVCLEAEQLLKEFAAHSGDTFVILRLSGIYGPQRLLRRLEDLRGGIPIAANGDEWLNLVHVDDIVRTLDHVAFCPTPPALMNVVSAAGQTRQQYYETLAELARTPTPVFDSSAAVPATGRQRGGNRRVVSQIRQACGISFLYENCHAGLLQALDGSATPETANGDATETSALPPDRQTR